MNKFSSPAAIYCVPRYREVVESAVYAGQTIDKMLSVMQGECTTLYIEFESDDWSEVKRSLKIWFAELANEALLD